MRFVFALLVVVIGLAACQKVVNLNLKNASGKYVIEGNVTNLPGPYQVTIGKTGEVTSDYSFTGVSGAVVTIRDNTGNGEALLEVQPGLYQTKSLQGVEGRTYSLSISVGGNTFTSSSVMPHPVNLDSLYIVDVYNFSKMVKAVVPVFTDPVGQGNSYRFNEMINGVLDKTLFYSNDDFSDGRTSTFNLLRPDPDSTLHVKDNVSVEMQCIDKEVYKYWYSVDQSSTGDGGNTASNPVTNITGGALGYFSAHTSQTKSILVR
ncbi:MAG TPA: DUF4249 domain-containing protein [Puia sp.]|jgi:hypothetical protein